MQVLRTNKRLLPQIRNFFKEIENNEFFRPHSFGSDYARTIAGYKGKNHYYFLVDEDERNKILGYAIIRGLEEGWRDNCIGVCVSPKERRRGYARILCQFLELVVRRKGFKRIRLHCNRSNNEAMSLYRKLGYKSQGVRKNGELVLYKELNK